MISFFHLLVAVNFTTTAADHVPTFDFMPSCRAGTASIMAPLDGCAKDERDAREQLVKGWAQFPSADKMRCSEETEHFSPSYVELLACIQMYSDVKSIPEE
jgi:hypothetical protein